MKTQGAFWALLLAFAAVPFSAAAQHHYDLKSQFPSQDDKEGFVRLAKLILTLEPNFDLRFDFDMFAHLFQQNRLDGVLALLNALKETDPKFNYKRWNQTNPVILALQKKQLGFMKTMLQVNPELASMHSYVDSDDITPLTISVSNNDLETTQFLLDSGAKVNDEIDVRGGNYGTPALTGDWDPKFFAIGGERWRWQQVEYQGTTGWVYGKYVVLRPMM